MRNLIFILGFIIFGANAFAQCDFSQAKQVAVEAFRKHGDDFKASTVNYTFNQWNNPTRYLAQGFIPDGQTRTILGPPPVTYGPWKEWRGFCEVLINDQCKVVNNVCRGDVETLEL